MLLLLIKFKSVLCFVTDLIFQDQCQCPPYPLWIKGGHTDQYKRKWPSVKAKWPHWSREVDWGEVGRQSNLYKAEPGGGTISSDANNEAERYLSGAGRMKDQEPPLQQNFQEANGFKSHSSFPVVPTSDGYFVQDILLIDSESKCRMVPKPPKINRLLDFFSFF